MRTAALRSPGFQLNVRQMSIAKQQAVKKFGFTPEHVVAAAREQLARRKGVAHDTCDLP